ncbi:hypothetical protein P280DRAFT_520707 [Massarina eburnea CBS 473.64]|uniref:FAM192A/Fyv6 N-terminal domain-containing protein n=1 Tax=Massarina eburnea CBS 473.64 TaxID=1395130 RepID=A0A6A6RSU9_9PLEO|nr:hypothetical protein P280DRAFT_520707 [Massarina eburnea CBS 473.64]
MGADHFNIELLYTPRSTLAHTPAASPRTMSNFISAGTTEAPISRDAEWHAAQAEIEERHRIKHEQNKLQDGKSLFDVLQANKEAKQEAFEEAAKLKHQVRGLDDVESGFLETLGERERAVELERRREVAEGVEGFRRMREEIERKEREGGEEAGAGAGEGGEKVWKVGGRRRRVERGGLKGVKIMRGDGKGEKEGGGAEAEKASPKPLAAKPKPANALALGLGYASSDDG